MTNPYELLLSPFKIGNVTLKNRIMGSKCALQSFTLEQAREFYAGMAKNGAATVTVAMGDHPERNLNLPDKNGRMPHMDGTGNDMRDPAVVEGYRNIAKAVHEYGTLASASLMDIEPTDVNISDTPNWDEIPKNGDYNSAVFRNKPGISVERIQTLIDEFAFRAKEAKDMGFDMCTFYMSYRSSILACSMSPLLNQRTDKYGGKTMAERATLAKEVFSKVKELCGQDFLIEAQISAVEEAPGYTFEDFLDFCQALEGYVDIIQIRGVDGSATHVNGLNYKKGHPHSIDYAAAFKARGIKIACAPVGGYGDPEMMEGFLKEGKTDLFAMARQFLADDHYYEKLQAGAPAQEIVPCILCNGCHGHHTCSVNPRLGRKRNLFAPETSPKKVAVIGGGPAGMRAAIYAAQRGHDVTLYEKSGQLGGQLFHSDYFPFKWPIKNFKNWLIYELGKSGAKVVMNTAPTRQMIVAGGYDVVLAATGAKVNIPNIPGLKDENGKLKPEYMSCLDTCGKEPKLGKHVVIVGGSEVGIETAMYLCGKGHDVTVLTRQKKLAHNASSLHYITMAFVKAGPNGEAREASAWEAYDNLTGITEAETVKVEGNTVTYRMADGEHTVTGDSVVICGGMTPLTAEAFGYSGLTTEFYAIGDCNGAGNLEVCNREAYSRAMIL